MKHRSVFPLIAAMMMTACASSKPSPSINQPGGMEVSGRTVFETLPPQDVRASQCPLVLYSRADESRRIFVSLDTPPTALIRIDGRTQQFTRTSTSGATSNRHFEEETYATPDGARLTASVRFAPLSDASPGAAIRSASLAYTSPEGETAVIPAVGLVSCLPDG